MALWEDAGLLISNCEFGSNTQQKLISVMSSLFRFASPFCKMSTDFRWSGSSKNVGLKIRVRILLGSAAVSDCSSDRVENNTPSARYKQYIHRCRICPPHLHHTHVITWAMYAMSGMLREATQITVIHLG